MSTNYFTKEEIDLLLAQKLDIESSVSLEFTIPGAGVILVTPDAAHRWLVDLDSEGRLRTTQLT